MGVRAPADVGWREAARSPHQAPPARRWSRRHRLSDSGREPSPAAWLRPSRRHERRVRRRRGLWRLKEVADVLGARGVLFATTGEFSVRTRERVDSIFARWPRPESDFVERLPT